MVFLLAPTVPSEPIPKKTARSVRGDSMSRVRSQGRLMPPTSSLMPIVNRERGRSALSSVKMPATIAGVNSFEESP